MKPRNSNKDASNIKKLRHLDRNVAFTVRRYVTSALLSMTLPVPLSQQNELGATYFAYAPSSVFQNFRVQGLKYTSILFKYFLDDMVIMQIVETKDDLYRVRKSPEFIKSLMANEHFSMRFVRRAWLRYVGQPIPGMEDDLEEILKGLNKDRDDDDVQSTIQTAHDHVHEINEVNKTPVEVMDLSEASEFLVPEEKRTPSIPPPPAEETITPILAPPDVVPDPPASVSVGEIAVVPSLPRYEVVVDENVVNDSRWKEFLSEQDQERVSQALTAVVQMLDMDQYTRRGLFPEAAKEGWTLEFLRKMEEAGYIRKKGDRSQTRWSCVASKISELGKDEDLIPYVLSKYEYSVYQSQRRSADIVQPPSEPTEIVVDSEALTVTQPNDLRAEVHKQGQLMDKMVTLITGLATDNRTLLRRVEELETRVKELESNR